MQAKKEIRRSYAYDRTFTLIDYKGKVREKENVGVSENFSYGLEYSPNNIRALVISPDAVMVMYHVKANGRKIAEVRLNPVQYTNAVTKGVGKDKRIIETLTADRKCSCVEEIIYLSQPEPPEQYTGLSSPMNLQYEAEFGVLGIRPGVQSNTYPRLRYISMLNMTYSQFKQVLSGGSGSHMFITDMLLEKAGNAFIGTPYTFGNSDTWFECGKTFARLQGGYYAMDAVGNNTPFSLRKHFEAVENKCREVSKARKDTDKKESVGKGELDKFQSAYGRYAGVVKCMKMVDILLDGNTNTVADMVSLDYSALGQRSHVLLTKLACLDNTGANATMVRWHEVEEQKLSRDDKNLLLKDNIKRLQDATTKGYVSLLSVYLSGLEGIRRVFPQMFNLVKERMNKSVMIPPQGVFGSSLSEVIGVVDFLDLHSSDFKTSVSSVCSGIVTLFASNQVQGKPCRKFEDMVAWRGVLDMWKEVADKT